MHCHEEASFILAGLALQAEISDYDESLGQNYFMAEHFLPQRVCKTFSVLVLDTRSIGTTIAVGQNMQICHSLRCKQNR